MVSTLCYSIFIKTNVVSNFRSSPRSGSFPPSNTSLSASYLAVPPTPLPSSSSSSPPPVPSCMSPVPLVDTGSYYPGIMSPCPQHHCPAPLSPDSKRRLAELSHDLSLAQKLSLVTMWLIAACYGITACFPEKVISNFLL